MKKLSLAVAMAFVAVGAQALTISGGSFSNPQTTTEISQTGTLNLFDSSLGMLTDVELTIEGAFTTSITLSNSSATDAQTVKADGTVNLFFTSTIGALSAAFASPAMILAATTGFTDIPTGTSQSFGPLSDSQTSTLNAALDAFIASFASAGGGTFDIGCTSLSGLAVTGGGGNISADQTTTAGCGASIIYTFSATPPPGIPEPASLALVGIALAAAGLASRRKSA